MNPSNTPQQRSAAGAFLDWLWFALKVLVLFIIIRYFIITAFVVSGASMVPTFDDNDYLIVERVSYHFKDPSRYDVVVIDEPHIGKHIIKRVIGLPGETIYTDGASTTVVSPAGTFKLDEKYINANPEIIENRFQAITLKEGEFFVMGDNRGASRDSRDLGPIDRSVIIGRPLIRLLPLDEVKVYPGSVEQKN